MKFRKAELKDYPALADLISRSIDSITSDAYPRKTLKRWIESYTKDSTLKGKLADPESYFVLLIEGDSIIGEGILTGNEIHGVYADPDSPVKKIGTIIMNHLEEYAADMGLNEITIHAALTSKGFYLKRGYEETGDMMFDLDGYLSPGMTMKKKL